MQAGDLRKNGKIGSACSRMFLYGPFILYDVIVPSQSKTLIVLGIDAPYQNRISKDWELLLQRSRHLQKPVRLSLQCTVGEAVHQPRGLFIGFGVLRLGFRP